MERYLSYSLALTKREQELVALFREWLPDQIIDVHAHCNLAEHVGDIDETMYRHMMTTFPSFTLEESLRNREVFFPTKTVQSLRFPNVFRGINFRAANAYLLSASGEQDRVALCGIPTDTDYTVAMMAHPRVSALKMYYIFFDPPATIIYQYFPPEVLEEAQSRSIPIILHLPRMITKCEDDLRTVLQDFPRLKVVLAHLGLPHLPVSGLREAYEAFALYPNLVMDTAMIPSREVVELALKVFGHERIMFGSDEPLNMVRSTVYEHPNLGQRLATEYLYHWVDPTEHASYKHLARGSIHSHWQALLALKEAIETLPAREQEEAKKAIFYSTARRVYGF